MNRIVKYNLEIMSCIFVVAIIIGLCGWKEISVLRQMTVIFMLLFTLHEWEESRFPGGFYKIFFSKCTIDETVSEEKMHFPVAIYLLIILLCPFIFDGPISIVLIPLMLALFEGFIHTAGIVIHQLKKPYSPGMITAWIMFIYAAVMIHRLNMQIELNTMDWILGIVLFLITFLIMETQFVKTVGITIREFQTSMKKYMIGRIKRNR